MQTNSDSKTKILVGIFMLLLVIIYCLNRIINHLGLRLFDLTCWMIMIISGIILIVKGVQFTKK
jgi:hypothetical protein